MTDMTMDSLPTHSRVVDRPTIKFPTVDQMKRIWADFKRYVGEEVVAPVVEFFREVPARAAANCMVTFESAKRNNPKAFAIVNWALRAGGDAVRAFDKGMGAGASGGGGFKVTTKPAPKSTHARGQDTNWVPKPGK